DYQPDWSPDGRLVVFARYTHDAIELQLLDLAAKTVQPVTANGAVNVEPRWSPDGTRIAFVSSAYNRRWHIFTVAIAGGTVGLQPAVAHLHGRDRGRHAGGRDGHTPHRGQRQPAAALLLQRVGSLSLTHLVPGRTGVDHRLEPRAHPRDRRILAHDRDSRRPHTGAAV